VHIDGFQQTSSSKLVDAVQKRFFAADAVIDPVVLAAASNAFGRGVGEKKLRAVVDALPKLLADESWIPSVEQLVQVEGIETKTADLVIRGKTRFWDFVKSNQLQRFVTQQQQQQPVSSDEPIFRGQSFVFTGVRDNAVERYIASRGGEIKTSMSKKVTHLICKDASVESKKIQEARRFGIQIMSLDDFKRQHSL
jgi:NAD-dependent DNA ligase